MHYILFIPYRKINSADCVDMDCDALKKALLKDLDGSFLGHVGSVIPQSEFEWDTNPQRGLGDYRIPKEMLTDMNGDRLDVNTVAPHKGKYEYLFDFFFFMFLCPHIERSGGILFYRCPSVRPSVCLHKLNVKT